MDRSYLLRGLRIAFSAVCGILVVLLVAMWVRSYWWVDLVSTGNCQVQSFCGTFGTHLFTEPWPGSWYVLHQSLTEMREAGVEFAPRGRFGFDFQFAKWPVSIQLPYWLLLLAASLSAVAPWLRWKFSLRALLLVTTLIAALLGLTAAWLRQ